MLYKSSAYALDITPALDLEPPLNIAKTTPLAEVDHAFTPKLQRARAIERWGIPDTRRAGRSQYSGRGLRHHWMMEWRHSPAQTFWF